MYEITYKKTLKIDWHFQRKIVAELQPNFELAKIWFLLQELSATIFQAKKGGFQYFESWFVKNTQPSTLLTEFCKNVTQCRENIFYQIMIEMSIENGPILQL